MSSFYPEIFHYNDYYRTKYIEEIAATLPKKTKILDVGAGPCKYKITFSHCDYKSQDFALFDGEGHSYGKLDYISDILSIPVENGSFDCILCTEVFEHIPRPDLALKEFYRILKKNGMLILTTPLGSGVHMAPYHFYGGFSPYWFLHFLPLNGFELKSCKANGGFFKLYGQESQRFLHLITPTKTYYKILFLPIKLVLALWFKLTIPIVCHFLDKKEIEPNFTAGYFVTAYKK